MDQEVDQDAWTLPLTQSLSGRSLDGNWIGCITGGKST